MLETERLTLDPWETSDWLAFRLIATDVDVMRYIGGGVPWTDGQIQDFVGRQMKLYGDRGFCRWKLSGKDTGELIGICGVGFWPGFPDLEIGWWLARRYWGCGLATEAAGAALHDAFERVELDRIVSVARPENVASTHIMRKLGFEFECELENPEGFKVHRYALDRARYLASSQAGRFTSRRKDVS